MTTLAEALATTVAHLRDAGVPSPEVDARWLVEAATGSDPRRAPDRPLAPGEQRALDELRARRGAREPLQLVLGTAAFVWYFLDEAPVGYIFGDKLSIFLLMYVGFIGASMATRDGKHIRIDFIRKKVPLTKLNLYNAISGLVAVSFTLFLGALSLDYLTGRLKYGGHVEGLVIADYLVALPIVVGVLVIALRFGKAALDDLGAHLRGEIAKPVEMELL